MSIIKGVAGWLGRHILLFALGFLALLAYAVWTEHKQEIELQLPGSDSDLAARNAEMTAEHASLQKKIDLAKQAEASLADAESEASAELRQFEREFSSQSETRLRQKLTEIESRQDQINSEMPSVAAQIRAAARQDIQFLEDVGRKKIELVVLERQAKFINSSLSFNSGVAAQRLKEARDGWTDARDKRNRQCSSFRRAQQDWLRIKRRPYFSDLRGRVDGSRRAALERLKKATRQCGNAIELLNKKRNALNTARKTFEEGKAQINSVMSGASREIAEARSAAEVRLEELATVKQDAEASFSSEAAKYDLADIGTKAFFFVLGIVAMPFVIRLIFYHILAPLAERRAAIRIAVPGQQDVKIPPSELSRVSIPVTLEKGEELLVRQDYLQTSSLTGSKSTRWLLDYTHVLSSIASGLTFLTRIRGAGETTTVSAVRDPFAELTQVKLPEGSACVLQPRALVAVVQPIRRTMRITSHWRLFSLNAWLTMQLRYLVFHGPGRLIVMGGRGIRVEHAERGRIFGQDQLVGFSSDLAYSVTRTETFWPYFFGREQLFKDKVEQGNGILIIEEAPLSGRKGAGVKRGLEGAFDAGLKAFGI